MNKFFSRSAIRNVKRTAKDLIGSSQASNSMLAPFLVPIQQVKKFNESLQRDLSNVAYLLNESQGLGPQVSLAGAGGSRFNYPTGLQGFSKDDSILFSKPFDGSGDSQRSDIKTGTTEQDNTHTSQKPIKSEESVGSQARPQRVLKRKFENASTNAVPASSLSRAFEFAGLGFKLATSALGGKIRGTVSSDDRAVYNSVVNEKNADLITRTLCRMRGIPLKLGQTLSIQDDNLIPPAFKEALERAQRSADMMPDSQVDQMLKEELGIDWMSRFQEFDRQPIAAASIGQVHKAITKSGKTVAVKVQYPGVAESIDSDLQNLKRLVTYLNLLPKTMYVDNILTHTRNELKEECDYVLEGEKQMKMRELLKKKKGIIVPAVIPELSTKRVLTSDWVDGIGIDECQDVLTQEEKDRLGHKIFHVLLTQLFELRYVQTDPNPANFFYNPETDTLSIIDYGAARVYSKEFVSTYLDVIYGAATNNPDLVYTASVRLGFLTGEESKEMKEAHVGAVMIVGEPFAAKGAFDFGNANMTSRIYEKIPHMVKNRLRPPPQEVYSLHRILSGAYLACIKLKARVNVGKIFKEVYTNALPDLKS